MSKINMNKIDSVNKISANNISNCSHEVHTLQDTRKMQDSEELGERSMSCSERFQESQLKSAKSIIKQAKELKIKTDASGSKIENKAMTTITESKIATAMSGTMVEGARMSNTATNMNNGMMETKSMNGGAGMNVAHRLETLEKTIRLMNSGLISGNEPTEENMSAQIDSGMSASVKDIRSYMLDGNYQSKSLNYVEAQGGALLPSNISGKIIELIKEICPLMEHASIYGTKSKKISFSVNTSEDSTAMWHDAWKNPRGHNKADTFTPVLDTKDVSLHTCLAVVDVDRDFIEDIGSDVLSWMESRVSSDFSSQINMAMLVGDGIHMPKGIFNDENFVTIKGAANERAVVIASAAVVRPANNAAEGNNADGNAQPQAQAGSINYVEVLLSMLGKMRDEFLADAKWYVSQEFFAKLISAMSTQTGEASIYKHLQHAAADSGATYMLFGKPVYVLKGMDNELVKAKRCPIMLANLKAGYYVAKHPEVRFTQRLEGDAENVRFLYRMRIGGDVANPNAFVLGIAA